MKIHRVVQMLGLINESGRLASDMYDLNNKEYYSKAESKYIPISHMDFQHMVRAFVKQNDEDIRNDTQEGKLADLYDTIDKLQDDNKKLREDLQGGFKQSVDDLDSLDAQEKIIAGLRSQVETLSDKVKDQDRGRVLRIKELKEQLEEKDELIDRWSKAEHRWRKAYHDSVYTNGHYYTFSEVPQDEEGKEFVKNCKKYLNKESYAIRVKGQHLKKELYGQGRAYHGANMEDSSHMRVYIDKKRGD